MRLQQRVPTTTPPRAPEEPTVQRNEPDEEPAPVHAHPPRVAKAALTPMKGLKLKPALVTFTKHADETEVASDSLTGIKPGTYYLVVHDGSCANGGKGIGSQWSAHSPLLVWITETKLAANVILAKVGDDAMTGRVLVLRDDKNGKPGKALACGVIEQTDDE